jgi:eukaryotic-like serine/threonine-protein kinase
MVDAKSTTVPEEDAGEDLLAGTPYRFLRCVTAGALGQIVEAEHLALRRRVIVKLVRPVYAAMPGFLDRFRLEAQVLAALAPRTQHVVAVQDFGATPEGRPFLVLERLSGCTLMEELRARRQIPPSEAVELACDLLDALSCAHEVGILHRDVKPANVFLAESERGGRVLKLLDFGIANVLPGASNDASDGQRPAPLSLLAEEGATLGAPRYLSPEHLGVGAVGPPSDLYSAGAVLYAMLTGRDPFAHHDGVAAVLAAQLSELPRRPSFVAAQPIPEALERVVLKSLTKRPEDRFASAAAFSAALRESLAPKAVSPRWDVTEPMNVAAFQGAVARASARQPPNGTELLDVSAFRGGLVRRAPPPGPAAPTIASPVQPTSIALALPTSQSSAVPFRGPDPRPVAAHRGRTGHGRWTATTAFLLATFVALLCALAALLLAGAR